MSTRTHGSRVHALACMTALACMAALAGCSFFTVQSATERGPHCTDGYAGPVVDTSAVATIAVLLTTALSGDECEGGACATTAVSSPVALVGGLYAASAVYGVVVVRGCNNHRAKMAHQVESMIANLVPVAEAGACEEVRRAVIVAEELSKDLGVKYSLTNPAVLRCLVQPAAPAASSNGT